jgi:hypothetical protein
MPYSLSEKVALEVARFVRECAESRDPNEPEYTFKFSVAAGVLTVICSGGPELVIETE